MVEAISDRINRYMLDGDDDDLRRLLAVSEVLGDMARRAFRRVGVAAGSAEVQEMLSSLRAAKEGAYEWVTSPYFLDLALRKPGAP